VSRSRLPAVVAVVAAVASRPSVRADPARAAQVDPVARRAPAGQVAQVDLVISEARVAPETIAAREDLAALATTVDQADLVTSVDREA
jgi:hypothetical protein